MPARYQNHTSFLLLSISTIDDFRKFCVISFSCSMSKSADRVSSCDFQKWQQVSMVHSNFQGGGGFMHMPTSNWFMILASCRPFGCMRLHRYKRYVGDFIVIRSKCSFLIHALNRAYQQWASSCNASSLRSASRTSLPICTKCIQYWRMGTRWIWFPSWCWPNCGRTIYTTSFRHGVFAIVCGTCSWYGAEWDLCVWMTPYHRWSPDLNTFIYVIGQRRWRSLFPSWIICSYSVVRVYTHLLWAWRAAGWSPM